MYTRLHWCVFCFGFQSEVGNEYEVNTIPYKWCANFKNLWQIILEDRRNQAVHSTLYFCLSMSPHAVIKKRDNEIH